MSFAATHLSCVVMATHSPKDVRAFDQAAAMRLQLMLECVSCSLCDAFCHVFPSSAPSFSSGNVVTGSRGHAPFPTWLKTHPECFQSPSSRCAGAPGTVWLASGQVICPKAELVKQVIRLRQWGRSVLSYQVEEGLSWGGWGWQEAKTTYQALFPISVLLPFTSLFAVLPKSY